MVESIIQKQFRQRVESSFNPKLIKIRKSTPMRFPKAIEDYYVKQLKSMVDKSYRYFLSGLPDIREIYYKIKGKRPGVIKLDDDSDELNAELLVLFLMMNNVYNKNDIDRITEQAAKSTSVFNRNQIVKIIMTKIGISLFLSEDWLSEELSLWKKQNESLILNISNKFKSDLSESIYRGIREWKSFDDIVKDIRVSYKKTQRRAELIARDQIGKLDSQLTMLRQVEAGVKSYVWNTKRDKRVRPDHRSRQGKVFKWSKPPFDGHPGQPVLCRCWAEPYLGDILNMPESHI